MRTGFDPKIPKVEMQFVPVQKGHVLVIRVGKSWTSPHRVTLGGGGGRFYGRNSAGKFPMDTTELRNAFTLSQGTAQRIGDFKHGRVGQIHSHATPIAIHLGCKLALHIIPLSAFTSTDSIDVSANHDILRQFHPLGRDQFQNSTINLEGILNYANLSEGRSHSYVQVYRSGILEAVGVFAENGGKRLISSKVFERWLVTGVHRYLPLLAQLDIVPPIYLFLSLVGATGFAFAVPIDPSGALGFDQVLADREILTMSELVVTDTAVPAHTILRPAFNQVWNAFGYAESQYFDDAGNWRDNR